MTTQELEQTPDGAVLRDYLQIASVTDQAHVEELQRDAAPMLERGTATKAALADLERVHGPWLRKLQAELAKVDLARFRVLSRHVEPLQRLTSEVLLSLVRYPQQISRGEEVLAGLHGTLQEMREQAAGAQFEIRNVAGSEAGIAKKIEEIKRLYAEIPAHQKDTPIVELSPVEEPTEGEPAPRYAECRSFGRGRT
jgi:hypothetical protein